MESSNKRIIQRLQMIDQKMTVAEALQYYRDTDVIYSEKTEETKK